MKKTLIILLTLLLSACNTNNVTSSIKVVEEINTSQLMNLLNTENKDMSIKYLNSKVSFDYYEKTSNILTAEVFDIDAFDKDEQQYIRFLSDFYIELNDEYDNNPIKSSMIIGHPEEKGNSGILIYEFENNLSLSDDLIKSINSSTSNDFEFIFYYKNILLTVDYEYMNNSDDFNRELNTVLESVLGE